MLAASDKLELDFVPILSTDKTSELLRFFCTHSLILAPCLPAVGNISPGGQDLITV